MAAKQLTTTRLEKYKNVLLKEKEETQGIINAINEIQKRGSKDGNGDLSAYSQHQADQGSDTDESERRVYLLEQELENIKKINSALKRIYDKTYGICEICGNTIPANRLKIIPYAKYCIKCKEVDDQRKRRKK
ncbi:MAG: TraR/DksA C4-type zinc finger protein [Candidatus Cloacimonetes bacterium]|jgi:DnaK suppressor protein|nr:TraR/DksA C4-type zinc finger protein [Candidatus Cloacimonadota bacterium]